jgi:hypothetical protein
MAETQHERIARLVDGIDLVCKEHGANCDPHLTTTEVKALSAEIAELREQLRQRDEMLAAAWEIVFRDDSKITRLDSSQWLTPNDTWHATALEAYAAIKESEKQIAVE